MPGSGRHHRKNGMQSLNEEVRDALLTILRDSTAPPTARAIAGRSLIQLIGE